MDWIHNYQLFLFDFDGLLVNTEELHFKAYKKMCAARGFTLPWKFSDFSKAAHHSSTGLRDQVYADLPELYALEPDWKILYAEKKKAYIELLDDGEISLMPGVAKLLGSLEKANIRRCVVTHSALEFIDIIKKHQPLLNSIPNWVTREHYSQPKPNPECYLKAIEMHGKPSDNIIGFEDVPKGLQALLGTRAKPVLICPSDVSYLESYPNVKQYPSFENINDANKP